MNDYNENEESKYFIHLHINSYFKCAISSYLPGNDFKWLTEEEIKNFDAQKMYYRSKYGYSIILE